MESIDRLTHQTFYSEEATSAEKHPLPLSEKISQFFQNMKETFADMELMRPYSSWEFQEP